MSLQGLCDVSAMSRFFQNNGYTLTKTGGVERAAFSTSRLPTPVSFRNSVSYLNIPVVIPDLFAIAHPQLFYIKICKVYTNVLYLQSKRNQSYGNLCKKTHYVPLQSRSD